MTLGLSPSRIVLVNMSLAALAAARRNFGAMLLVDSSDVIDTDEGMRQYDGITDLATDFSISADVYKAAKVFFSQSPQPSLCYIGRWAQTATKGRLNGGLLSSAEQVLTNFTAVTSGAMELEVDTVPISLTDINLSSATNLNGVASLVQTALQAKATDATVVWDATQSRFQIKSGTTGTTSKVGLAQAPTATGYITFGSNPSADDTVTLNGVAITFKASGASGNQVNIGASLTATLVALTSFLNASANASLTVANYSSDATKLYIEYKTTGTGGNAYTLAASAGTRSAATLSGGSGTDISSLLGLTSGDSAVSVDGVAAETAEECVLRLLDFSNEWYGLVMPDTNMTNDDHLSVASLIEAASPARIYGVTTQSAATLQPDSTTDLAYMMKDAGYQRTLVQYSSSNAYAVASLVGRFATVNFEGVNTTITVMFKQEPGITSEKLTGTQSNALKAKNCNVFAYYSNGTAIVQYGKMAGGWYIDERHGADWMADRYQNDVYNLLLTSPKIPQTNKGAARIKAVLERASEQAVTNGWVATGLWTGEPFGQLATNQILETGYYHYVQTMEQQSQSDRENRHAPAIKSALKLAGAIHDVVIDVVVNR